ncbi:MAG: hypothetical protein FWE27_04905 [Defluviitaleaceae bacterium]|nr:hypothetical protein [Defluviitaleaceae bacterium]
MRGLLSFIVIVATLLFAIFFIITSNYVNRRMPEVEIIITESIHSFLDTVTDRGRITQADYDRLQQRLAATGGTFEVEVQVQRLTTISSNSPLAEEPEGITGPNPFFVTRQFRPIHFLSTQAGTFQNADVVLRRFDNVSIQLQQLTQFDYQVMLGRQQGQTRPMRIWTFARPVRNNGSLHVGNEPMPLIPDNY